MFTKLLFAFSLKEFIEDTALLYELIINQVRNW